MPSQCLLYLKENILDYSANVEKWYSLYISILLYIDGMMGQIPMVDMLLVGISKRKRGLGRICFDIMRILLYFQVLSVLSSFVAAVFRSCFMHRVYNQIRRVIGQILLSQHDFLLDEHSEQIEIHNFTQ